MFQVFLITKTGLKNPVSSMRGLRDDFRTMDWGEIARELDFRLLKKFLEI